MKDNFGMTREQFQAWLLKHEEPECGVLAAGGLVEAGLWPPKLPGENNMNVIVQTEHPVAYESHDHIVPHGTANDNTHYPWFVTKSQRIFGRKVKHMDLGCAGGGLVKDFLDMNHFSIGIEGSDFSLKSKRAEWATIPQNLFTADITKPFTVRALLASDYSTVQFDVISAWEVMEHIPEDLLPGLFDNVKRHLLNDGLFVCSIAEFPDEGYHVTLHPKPWWVEKFKANGLEPVEGIYVDGDYVRESSFYITARKANGQG